VIAALSQNGTSIPLNVKTRQVLSPQKAADVDYALSFDNNNPQGTAEANVPYRRGDVVGKTGTLGQNQVASQAWFIGGLPRGLAMSVALFTNLPGTQNLDNLPSMPGAPGSQGGGWPAFTWNAYMTRYNNNAPQISLSAFPQQQGPPFQPWILAKVKKVKLPTCGPFQTTNCTQPKNCNPFGHGNGNGNGNCNGNPNGNPTSTPSPGTSCNPFQQQCTSPSPSFSPSPSPSCSPGGPPCNTTGVAGTTTSVSMGSLSGAQAQPAEETTLAEVMALKQRALAFPAFA
jgi:membrane peptidoglycan carboxypeptidase